MNNTQLIEKAASVVNIRTVGDFSIGDVGCALIAENGQVYTGVCIDVGSSMGFCAEHNAIGTMVTDGAYKIKKIVAVSKNKAGEVFVVSPCGRCRQFQLEIDPANADTEVLLSPSSSVKLLDLLPHSNTFNKV